MQRPAAPPHRDSIAAGPAGSGGTIGRVPLRLPPTAVCLRCGYSLRGLETPRCPECGSAFDPADRRTYARRADRPDHDRLLPGRLVVGVLLLTFLAWVAAWLAVASIFG